MGAAEAGLFPVVQYLVGVGADLNLQSKVRHFDVFTTLHIIR